MNYIVNRIDLDVHDAGAQAWINVRQNETNRKICIALTESGEPFALTEDCDAVFAGTKPDATVFFNSCEITGNTIEYVLTGQNLAQTGDLKCEIRLYGSGNTLICSPRFVVHVQENAVDDNGIESADEFSELTELISEAREATDAANASVITGATASVDSNVGTPEVELTLTQEENGQSMDFEFHNLKGETGDPGVHVGDTAPTNPAISLWIDTDDNGASQVLSVMGTFASLAALQAAVTNPNNGDSYGVGTAAPYDIYRYDESSGEWINYGNYKGDTGSQGPTGPTGAAGADGFSPIVTVTKSGSAATITITDKNGTTTATVSDGEVTQEQLDTKAPAVTETTESSAIANFPDGADDMPLHNILAEINPVQDLTYGDPYPAGGGVNKFDGSAVTTTHSSNWGIDWNATTNVLTITQKTSYTTGTPTFSLNLPSGTYVVSYQSISETGKISLYTDGSWVKSLNNGVTFTLDSTKTNEIRFANVTVTKFQLESGSTATAYFPYSNICPISGWTGCNVTRTGKNLCPKFTSGTSSGLTYTVSDNGEVTVTGTNTGTAFFSIPFTLKAGTYTLNGAPTGGQLTIRSANGGGAPSSAFSGTFDDFGSGATFTVSETASAWLNIRSVAGTHNDIYKPMIRLASDTDNTYEPYQSNTVTLSWQTEAGTVYGGTIDVATGLLTVTWAMITINGSTSLQVNGATANTSKFGVFVTGKANGKTNILSNLFAYPVGVIDAVGVVIGRDGNNFVEFSLPHDVAQTKAAGQAWFADNPTQLCYELATPQTYQLTPQEVLHALYGVNNVWADTGNVSVTYPADTKMFIEKLTQPTEDDLVANQAITSGKYFMVGNSLYLALANIASGAQITIGTNAQRVSLADALNTINS